MNIIADWIEQKIQAAMAKGEFDNLPGTGKPLDLDDDTFAPADMKMAYRILKNAGTLPQELTIYQEIQALRCKIAENQTLANEDLQKLKFKLMQRETEFNMALERLRK